MPWQSNTCCGRHVLGLLACITQQEVSGGVRGKEVMIMEYQRPTIHEIDLLEELDLAVACGCTVA